MKNKTAVAGSIGITAFCALAASCGGGGSSGPPSPPPTYTISGTVTGLSGSGLVLQNNGGNNTTATGSSFTFSTPITSGANYAVTVLTQPTGPSQTCTVSNGSGTVTSNVANVGITCTTFAAQSLGGIWQGTNPVNNSPVVAVSDENSNFIFYFADTQLFYGTAGINGDLATTNQFSAVANLGRVFTDTYPGRLDAVVTARQTLTMSTTLNNGQTLFYWGGLPASQTNVRYQFNSQYLSSSSLPLIAGTYRDNPLAPTATLTVAANGLISGSRPDLYSSVSNPPPCSVTGQVTLINPSFNLYAISLTSTNSNGSPCLTLSGSTATGYAYLDLSQSPAALVVLAHTNAPLRQAGSSFSARLLR